MSWAQWPNTAMPQPGVVQTPMINPAPNVVNPAAPVVAATNQYTPEQWAQMQQQNWQQWAQWQQQFQQWQQQYGAEFQKSLTAMAQTTPTPVQPPLPFFNASAPPPLPTETKPPPPPDDPQISNQPSNQTPYSSSFLNGPPPSVSSQPPPPNEPFQNQYNQPQPNQSGFQNRNPNEAYKNENQQRFGGNNQNFPNRAPVRNQNWQNPNNRNHPTFGNQPPAVSNENRNRPDYGTKRPFNQPPEAGDVKRNKMEINVETNRWQPNQQKPKWTEGPPNQVENPQWVGSKPPENIPKRNPEELTEQEKKFDKQFAEWESQFQKWKEQNANHPDKEQYREYEKKWEAWRTQLLERREQMKRKRLGLVSESPQPTSVKPENTQQKPLDNQQSSISESVHNRPAITSAQPQISPRQPQIGPQSFPPTTTASRSQNVAVISQITLNPNRPPPNMNDQPLEFNKTQSGSEEESQSQQGNDLSASQGDAGEGFLKSTSTGGIPGLDLVKDGKDEDKGDADVTDLKGSKETEKGPDLEAISRGINSILGDQKLLNMLSLVSQNQSRPLVSNTVNTMSSMKVHSPKFSPPDSLQNEQSNQENAEFYENKNQKEMLSNIDEQTRSSFNIPNEADALEHDKFAKGSEEFRNDNDNFNRNTDSFGRNSGNWNRESEFNRNFSNFNQEQDDNFTESTDNFGRTSDNFGESDNFNKGPENFNRDPSSFNRGPSNFQRNCDNIRGPDNFNRSSDNFGRGPDAFNKDLGNVNRGVDNFNKGGANFNRDSDDFNRGFGENRNFDNLNRDNFNKGPDNFNRDPDNRNFDNFNRGSDSFYKGPGNFNRGPNNFNRAPDNFNRSSNNFNRGPDGFNRGPDNFNRGPDSFNKSDVFNRDSDNFGRGSDNFNRGPNNLNRGFDNFNRGLDNFNRGSDNLNRGSDNFNRGPDNFNRGLDNFNRGSDNFNRGPDNFNRGPDNLNRAPDNFNRGPDNFNRGPDNFNRGPDNFNRGPANFNRGPDNFNRGSDNFNRGSDNFQREQDNFGRGFDRIERNSNLGNFNRGPENSDRGLPQGNKDGRGFNNFGKEPDTINRNVGDSANRFEMRTDRPGSDFERFGRKPDNLSKEPGSFNEESNNSYDRDQDQFNQTAQNLNRDDFTNKGLESSDGDRFQPPSLVEWNRNDSVPSDPLPPNLKEMQQDKVQSDDDIWKPKTVTDYDHKTLKSTEPDVLVEPAYMFDYRHKPLNRIPYPQRPKWLSDMVKNYPEFDLLMSRPYEQQLRRYPVNERYDSRQSGDYLKYNDRTRKYYDDRERKLLDDRDRKPYDDYNRKQYDDRDRRPYEDQDRMSDRDKKPYDNPLKRLENRSDDRRSRDFGEKRSADSGMDDKRSFNRELDISDTDDYLEETRNDSFSKEKVHCNKEQKNKEETFSIKTSPIVPSKSNVTLIEDLLSPPGRYNRPPRLVIILRGPPGSGKSFLAKLIKDKEVENGGSAPRILCLDDYFMVEQEKEVEEDGRIVKVKEMEYEYEECMEASYRQSLMKSFKKTITDGYFNFIIVDNINDKVKYFGEMWSFAKQNGFQVYICQLELDVQTCTKRNIHGRSEIEIERCVSAWEPTPSHHPILDATSLIQSGSIPEVEMEEINSPPSENMNEEQSSMAPTNRSDRPEPWKTTSNWTTSGFNRFQQNQGRRGFDGLIWKNENNKRK
ncbi:hypothetical protein ILUMI_22116 [Ignelater luminosus]|uniref:YLP motif-containing protein 1 n=1 Tax=Ignelater luminosus TaxID=2038154 RepID=A0A8K0CF44_IGNLU|nr:hypothetical protein ILUMI_22116 [Ignelater luminosus]